MRQQNTEREFDRLARCRLWQWPEVSPLEGRSLRYLLSKGRGLEVVMDATSRMDVKSKELSGEKNLVSGSRDRFGSHFASNNRVSPIYEWKYGGRAFCQLVQRECQRIGIANFYGAASGKSNARRLCSKWSGWKWRFGRTCACPFNAWTR